MTEMMTRFLAMGFTLDQVAEMCTINPVKALGEENRLGSQQVGMQADISVPEIREGNWVVYDVIGGSRTVHKAVVPVLAVKKGEVFEAGFNPRSWGWEPDQALGWGSPISITT